MSTIDIDPRESEEEDVETNLRILNRKIQFSGSPNYHAGTEEHKYNCSTGLEMMAKNESFIFHRVEEKASLAIEPIPDPMLVPEPPIEMKEILPKTTQSQITETKINLKSPDSCDNNSSGELKNVSTEDDYLLHHGEDEVSLVIKRILDKIQFLTEVRDVSKQSEDEHDSISHQIQEETPIATEQARNLNQVSTEVKKMLHKATRNAGTKAKIHLTAPESCDSNCSSEQTSVDTKDDIICQRTKEGSPLNIEQGPVHSKAKESSVMEISYHTDCKTQEAEIPSVIEGKFPEITETPNIETHIDAIVPEGCEGICSNAIRTAVTDSKLNDNRDEGFLVIDPTPGFIQSIMVAFDHVECHK